MKSVLEYIRDMVSEDEKFTPKKGRDPRREKRMDARQARNQVLRRPSSLVSSRPPHINWLYVSDNGVPYVDMGEAVESGVIRRKYERTRYLMAGWNRPRWARNERHRNGKKEWGADRDAWAKAFVQDKSSRARMRAEQDWWNEAMEALEDEGF